MDACLAAPLPGLDVLMSASPPLSEDGESEFVAGPCVGCEFIPRPKLLLDTKAGSCITRDAGYGALKPDAKLLLLDAQALVSPPVSDASKVGLYARLPASLWIKAKALGTRGGKLLLYAGTGSSVKRNAGRGAFEPCVKPQLDAQIWYVPPQHMPALCCSR